MPYVMASRFGFSEPIRAVILGGRGGVGGALVSLLCESKDTQVLATSRDPTWCETPGRSNELRTRMDLTDDESIASLSDVVDRLLPRPNLVINCSGVLQTGVKQPERTWRHFDRASMREVFDVHVFGVAQLVRALLPRMPRAGRSVFASLSARVGSIGDNYLGGWYSYRASKAAQNMILKTTSIEARRKWPEMTVVALHPGTVDTALSQPFTRRTPRSKLFTREFAASRLAEVISGLTPEDSGGFFAWDGSPIPW